MWHHHYSRCLPWFIINGNKFQLPFSCLVTTCVQCMIRPCTTHSVNQYEPHLPLFSPTHMSPKTIPPLLRVTSLPTLLSICVLCACIFLSLSHLCACVHAYSSSHVTYVALGLDQPRTLLGHTPLVIFHSHHLIPALVHTNHPARSCLAASLAQPFWIMPTHRSWWVCVVQVQSDDVMFFCIKNLIILSEQ